MNTKKRTTTAGTVRLANFVGSNKAAFAGKNRQAAMALIEATFPGEYFSTGTINEVFAINGIVLRKNYSTGKTDRTRALARIVQAAVSKLASDLGTEVLSDYHLRQLASVIGGNAVEEST